MIRPEAMQRMRAKVQDKVTSTTPGTWGKVGLGVLVGGVAIGWLAFPYVLDKVVASQINLAQGKDSRKLWIQLPTFDFKVYLFNITNPAEVMQGAKAIVQEVGPYCYKEIKDKTDFVEDPTTDTISYSARNTWYDDQKGPNCPAPQLTGEEILVVPNIPILAILLIAEKDFPTPFMTLVNQALPNIFGKFSDIFMRVSAKKVLFDGIPINCSANALYPRAVCIALKQNSRALKKLGNNLYTFSYFGAKNNTPEEFRYTVKRGTENGQDVGRLVAVDGKEELPFWRGECNKIQGTDSTVFPPFRQAENGSLTAYSSEFCRVFYGAYAGTYDYKGVAGYSYTISVGDTESNPGERCYCSADNRCRKKGVIDALKCQGAPLVASLPHFYQANPDYVNGVVGLSPDKDKHGIFIVLEPISGTPLIARKRIQFSIELKPIRYVPVTQRLRRTLTPLFWAEETLDLDEDLMGLLEASLFRPIRAVDVIKWMCVVGGVGLGVTAAVLKFRKNRRDKVHVLNGEAGYDPNNGFDAKVAVKSNEEKLVQPFHTDPFLINVEETKLQTNGVINGFGRAGVMRSAPTISSANGVLLSGMHKSEIQPIPVNNGSMTLKQSEDNSYTYVIPQPDDNNLKTETFPYTYTTQPTLLDESTNNQVYNHESAQDILTPPMMHSNIPIKYTNDASELKSEFSNNDLPLPRFPNSSLEHQMVITSPLSPISKIPSSTIALAEDSRSPTPFSKQKPSSLDEMYSSTPNKPSPVSSGSGRGKQTSLNDTQLFGETIDENPHAQVASTTPTDEDNPNTGNDDLMNNYKLDTKPSNETNDPNMPAEEEIRAVEEDINRLIVEMAELIPKKLYIREDESK